MLKAWHGYVGQRLERGQHSQEKTKVAVEHPLAVHINGTPFTVLMCSPGMERELVLGLLLAEGIIVPGGLFEIRVIPGTEHQVLVELPGVDAATVANKRSLLSVTACGICGTRELSIPTGEPMLPSSVPPTLIPNAFAQMRSRQQLFEATGGVHSAGLFDGTGKLLSVSEDVGRHNAADKAIGQLLDAGNLASAFLMALSGRVSYEMMVKAFKARIPVVAAVSAPTSMAVDFALEWGIVLFGFCREERFTRFA